ncbi:WD40/YVTN/BNR-like repeat-containing protein [Paenibacillus pedocola]|uniref:WD40/YVTN/BNR-like repeat-containing protein n=1 Tax=Paenibacillus pedocola TaxID=3242193 RepID=UPI002877FF60|nr:hypothetical protein [Paenibacillus typhae]
MFVDILRKTAAALLVPLLLVTAGCGGSGGEAAESTPAASPPASAAIASSVPPPSGTAAAAPPAAGSAAQRGVPIRSISGLGMTGPDAGWIGGKGWIARTGNGGAEWQVQYTGPGTVLSLFALDNAHAWAELDTGSLLRTKDSGAHWTLTGSAPNREDLHFISPDTGFSGAAVTTDGGQTWGSLPVPGNVVGGVFYYDRLNGWAVTSASPKDFAFQRTTDGGVTWRTVLTRKTVSLTGAVIRSTGPDDAWVECIGDSGMHQTAYSLFHTSDGGRHWLTVLNHGTAGAGPAPGFAVDEVNEIPANNGAAPGMLVVLSNEEAYMSGYCSPCDNANTVGWTRDGGKTWTDGEQSFPGYIPAKLAMADNQHGWFVTGSPDDPAVLYTTDNGGRDWKRAFTFQGIDMERGVVTGQSSLPGGVQASGLIRLNWQEMKDIPKAEAWAGIPSDAVTISGQWLENFGGVQITFYIKPGDEEHVYADLGTAKGHYSLGPVGTYNYRKPEDITAEVSSLFTGLKLKITGGLGANLSLSSYYTIDEAGTPAGVLRVDTGHTHEADVDRDGTPEAVSAHGTPMTAYIYRWHNGHAEEAGLNDALHADSVMLRDDLIYEASDMGESEGGEYQLIPEGLIPAMPRAE